jgi:hypothetical protein
MIATRPRNNTSLLLCAVAILMAATVSSHALARHGADAIRAHEAVQQGDPWRHHCKDGRDRIVRALPDGIWAVEVWDGEVQVTSFLTREQDYIRKVIDDCGDAKEYMHP